MKVFELLELIGTRHPSHRIAPSCLSLLDNKEDKSAMVLLNSLNKVRNSVSNNSCDCNNGKPGDLCPAWFFAQFLADGGENVVMEWAKSVTVDNPEPQFIVNSAADKLKKKGLYNRASSGSKSGLIEAIEEETPADTLPTSTRAKTLNDVAELSEGADYSATSTVVRSRNRTRTNTSASDLSLQTPIATAIKLAGEISKLKLQAAKFACKLSMNQDDKQQLRGSRSPSFGQLIRNTFKKSTPSKQYVFAESLFTGDSNHTPSDSPSNRSRVNSSSSNPNSPTSAETNNPNYALIESILYHDAYSKKFLALKVLDPQNFLAEFSSQVLASLADSGVKFYKDVFDALFEVMVDQNNNETSSVGSASGLAIQDLTAYKIVMISISNCLDPDTELFCLQRLCLLFEHNENLRILLSENEWPLWVLHALLGESSDSDGDEEKVSPDSLLKWNSIVDNAAYDKIFKLRMQLIVKLVVYSIQYFENVENFRTHLGVFVKMLKFSDDILRVFFYASFSALVSSKALDSPEVSIISYLQNIVDLSTCLIEFIFFSMDDGKSFTLRIDPEINFPDLILSRVAMEFLAKIIKKDVLAHLELAKGSQKPEISGAAKEKISSDLEIFLESFVLVSDYFEKSSETSNIASIQHLFSALASKISSSLFDDLKFFKRRKLKFSVKDKELEGSIRLHTTLLIQNRLAGKKLSGKKGPSGILQLFSRECKDISSRVLLAHNLVRAKLKYKPVKPESSQINS
jgi:hypothetical protein